MLSFIPNNDSNYVAGKVLEHAHPGDILSLSLGSIGGGSVEYQWGSALSDLRDSGIIVVCSAGNRNKFLDALDTEDHPHGTFDAGCIVVGAASPNQRELILPIHQTSYGSRVSASGPGSGVYTTEYDLTTEDDEDYGFFSLTSAAVPVVAGCCAVVQGIRKARGFGPYTPAEMRTEIEATGKPLDFRYAPEKEGYLGNFMDLDPLVKRALQVPDYDNDGRVGFYDLTEWTRQGATTFDRLLEFARHYGRAWPDDYPLA